MPINPTYPGVYIQEVSSGVRTITGVSTSVAAFFGRTLKGPLNKAVHCLNYSTFLRIFGGSDPASDLAGSVKQFFDNGGSECYIVRLAAGTQKADITLENAAGTSVLLVSAKDAGNWGNNLRLQINYNTANPDETFNLSVTQEENGAITASETFLNLSMNPASPRYVVNFVTNSSNLIDVALAAGFNIETNAPLIGYSESRRPIPSADAAALRDFLNALIYTPPTAPSNFEISVNDGPFIPVNLRADPAPLPAPASFADLMTALNGKINPQLPPGVAIAFEQILVHTGFRILRINSNSGNNQSVKIRRATVDDLASVLMFGTDQGGVETARYANHRPVPTATFFSGSLNTLAALTQDAFNELTIVGSPTPNVVDLDASGANVINTTAAADRFYTDNYASSANDNNDGVREKLRALAIVINGTADLAMSAEVWGYHLALLPKSGTFNSSFDITTGNTGGGGTNIGAGGSNLFTRNVRQYALGNVGTSAFQTGAGTLGRDNDGNPGTPDLTVPDFLGSEIDHTGFYALDKVDLFNLMVIPPDAEIDEDEYIQIASAASIYCKNHRAFLLMDAPSDWSKSGNLNQDEVDYGQIRTGIVKDQTAIFYPRVIFSDAGNKKPIGPSGMIAGLMARTDTQRGVWKAPAGIEADLRGAFDVEVNLTDLENGILNKQGVNCIRKFPNGIVNWGARTLDGADDFGSEWKYIPIRRLALFLEESLFRGTKWVVFEPNDEPLWAKIRLNINAFMMNLFRQGAFQGSTPDKAFFVKCDSETTTPTDQNLGIVNIQVGFAPLKPAEFVIISIQQIPQF